MGFELYLNCFGAAEHTGIPRIALRSLFPIVEEESEPDYWRIRYDSANSCHIGVTAIPSAADMIGSLYVDRPCGHPLLWEALISVLRMGQVVMFWPGGPPVVAGDATDLPASTIASLGPPRSVTSAGELLRLVRE